LPGGGGSSPPCPPSVTLLLIRLVVLKRPSFQSQKYGMASRERSVVIVTNYCQVFMHYWADTSVTSALTLIKKLRKYLFAFFQGCI